MDRLYGYNNSNLKATKGECEMLHIFLGDMPSAIYNTEVYFKNVYEESRLLDEFAKKVIKKMTFLLYL